MAAFTPVTHVLFDMDGLILSKFLIFNILSFFTFTTETYDVLLNRTSCSIIYVFEILFVYSKFDYVYYRYRGIVHSCVSKHCV